MADYLKGRTTRTQGFQLSRVFVAGEEAEFIFGKGTQIFPNLPVPIWGSHESRMVLDADQRWFEFAFRIDHELTGNSATGWTDSGNYFKLEPQWSPDLVNWSMGKFVPAPVPVINNGDGTWTYWSRAIHPQDAAVKSGQVQCKSGSYGGALGEFSADARNNPLTALTVAGVVLALGGFPYTMPGDAARMQTDLRVFYPLATVTATTATAWEIIIPGVSQTSFTQTNKIFWPVYLVADMFGVVNTPVDGVSLTGTFVNASGVAIYNKGFGRLKISSGTRYDPYLLP